jgi:hypothetical protein
MALQFGNINVETGVYEQRRDFRAQPARRRFLPPKSIVWRTIESESRFPRHWL